MKTNMIKAIALFIAGSAIYPYIKSWESYWWRIDAALHGQGSFFPTDNLWLTVSSLLLYAIVLFKLIGAHGLFRIKSWGRFVTIGVLICDFAIKLVGAINLWTYNLRHPEMAELAKSLDVSSEYVQTVSAWPSYIIGITSLLFALYLLRPSVREKFITA